MTIFSFLDVETTGLSPRDNYILEVAWVFTDKYFNRLSAPAKSFIVDHGEDEAAVAEQIKGSAFITKMHTASGLLRDLANPSVAKYPMEGILDAFVDDIYTMGAHTDQVRFAGYSVSFDREFLRENGWGYILNEDTDSPFHMHHRILDMSSNIQLFEAARREIPEPEVWNENPHRALDDALDAMYKAQALRDDIRWA